MSSNLDNQIEKLLKFKKMRENYADYKTMVNKPWLHHQPEKEVVEAIVGFIDSKIAELDRGPNAAPPTPTKVIPANPPQVPSREIKNSDLGPPPKMGPALVQESEPSDPLKFMVKHKALAGKKVQFKTKDGIITGTVQMLRMPNIMVKTDLEGQLFPVAPKELEVIK